MAENVNSIYKEIALIVQANPKLQDKMLQLLKEESEELISQIKAHDGHVNSIPPEATFFRGVYGGRFALLTQLLTGAVMEMKPPDSKPANGILQ